LAFLAIFRLLIIVLVFILFYVLVYGFVKIYLKWVCFGTYQKKAQNQGIILEVPKTAIFKTFIQIFGVMFVTFVKSVSYLNDLLFLKHYSQSGAVNFINTVEL
jgi:ABC-type phosphate transport system permease subunit